MRVVVSDPEHFVGEREVEDDCKSIVELLGCDVFDVTTVQVCGRLIDCYCDDEGTFKPRPVPTVCDMKGMIRVVGKCFFAGHDSEGNMVSISNGDADAIMSRIRLIMDKQTGRWHEIIMSDAVE